MKILITIIMLISMTASADYVYDYSFLGNDPLKSTVGASKIEPSTSAPNSVVKVRVFDRHADNARRELKIRFFPSSGRKIVFVLPGLGSNADAPLGKFLAAYIQSSGASAVIIPNSLTSEFVLGASSHGIVGDVLTDARDTYVVMQATIRALREAGRTESEFSVVGFSLGALLASRVQEIDAVESQIGLQSALLINPPVSLLQGMRTLDVFYAQFKSMGIGSKLNLASKMKKFLELLGISPAQAEDIEMSDRDLQAAIGYTMRATFADMILATQQIHDEGILPEIQSERESEAKRIGFEKYVNEFLIPALAEDGRHFSLETLNGDTSLTAQGQYLASAQNVFVLHNRDDFLTNSPEIEWIESTFGHRARIYPRGGHMGNLNNEDNLKAIANWINNRPIN